MEYSASSVKYLLWFMETRETTRLLNDYSPEKVRELVLEENIYQQKDRRRIINQFGCISRRVDAMPLKLRELLLRADVSTAKLIVLISAINEIFIDTYELNEEVTTSVAEENLTLHDVDLTRDIKGLISYAVGCMFGRYSLDVEGLAYAGGDWQEALATKYKTFLPDEDAIIPITDEEYFKDDIVARLVDFVRIVYGEETLEENLNFYRGCAW